MNSVVDIQESLGGVPQKQYRRDVMVLTEWPACYGGGASACNPDTGDHEVTENNNNCCTRECTQRHEEQHVTDLDDCCQKFSDALSEGGDRGDLFDQYNNWVRRARPWAECRAYDVSLECAKEMASARNCSEEDTECCREIEGYRENARQGKNRFCPSAPDSLPECPF